MSEDIEIRRKRLIYRSKYTGMKETDLLLGRFASAHLPDFGESQLDEFEALLAAGDVNIYVWAVGREPVPEEYDTGVMRLLQRFKLRFDSEEGANSCR